MLISIKNLKWGIYVLIFTLPAYLIRFNIFDLPSTLLEGEILLLFVVFLILNFNKIKSFKFLEFFNKNKLLLVSCFLLLASSIISIFVSPNFVSALGLWKAYFIEPILFLIIFVSVIKKDPPKAEAFSRAGDIKNIFKILSIQVLILSLFAIFQKLTGAFISNPFWSAEATRRVTSIFPYPNALALYLAPIIILLLGNFVRKIKNNFGNWKLKFGNYLEIVSCILGFISVYFTKSKGALIALLVGIIFYAIFYKGYRKIFITITVIALIAFITIIAFNPVLIKGTSTVAGGDSISTRLDMWNETWQMLKTKPIFGAGLVGYQTAVAPFHTKDYIEIYLYPHNIFLNFWTEVGLLGLLAFIGIIFWFFKTGFSQIPNSKFQILTMASMTTLLVHGLVDVPYFKNDLAILFWLLIGMMIIWRGGREV
ncbi:O-antigen ligase family protein [Patescibacteria group bacterium]